MEGRESLSFVIIIYKKKKKVYWRVWKLWNISSSSSSFANSSHTSSSPRPCRCPGGPSVFARGGHQAVMASHLLQDLRQAAQVAVGEVLGLP